MSGGEDGEEEEDVVWMWVDPRAEPRSNDTANAFDSEWRGFLSIISENHGPLKAAETFQAAAAGYMENTARELRDRRFLLDTLPPELLAASVNKQPEKFSFVKEESSASKLLERLANGTPTCLPMGDVELLRRRLSATTTAALEGPRGRGSSKGGGEKSNGGGGGGEMVEAEQSAAANEAVKKAKKKTKKKTASAAAATATSTTTAAASTTPTSASTATANIKSTDYTKQLPRAPTPSSESLQFSQQQSAGLIPNVFDPRRKTLPLALQNKRIARTEKGKTAHKQATLIQDYLQRKFAEKPVNHAVAMEAHNQQMVELLSLNITGFRQALTAMVKDKTISPKSAQEAERCLERVLPKDPSETPPQRVWYEVPVGNNAKEVVNTPSEARRVIIEAVKKDDAGYKEAWESLNESVRGWDKITEDVISTADHNLLQEWGTDVDPALLYSTFGADNYHDDDDFDFDDDDDEDEVSDDNIKSSLLSKLGDAQLKALSRAQDILYAENMCGLVKGRDGAFKKKSNAGNSNKGGLLPGEVELEEPDYDDEYASNPLLRRPKVLKKKMSSKSNPHKNVTTNGKGGKHNNGPSVRIKELKSSDDDDESSLPDLEGEDGASDVDDSYYDDDDDDEDDDGDDEIPELEEDCRSSTGSYKYKPSDDDEDGDEDSDNDDDEDEWGYRGFEDEDFDYESDEHIVGCSCCRHLLEYQDGELPLRPPTSLQLGPGSILTLDEHAEQARLLVDMTGSLLCTGAGVVSFSHFEELVKQAYSDPSKSIAEHSLTCLLRKAFQGHCGLFLLMHLDSRNSSGGGGSTNENKGVDEACRMLYRADHFGPKGLPDSPKAWEAACKVSPRIAKTLHQRAQRMLERLTDLTPQGAATLEKNAVSIIADILSPILVDAVFPDPEGGESPVPPGGTFDARIVNVKSGISKAILLGLTRLEQRQKLTTSLCETIVTHVMDILEPSDREKYIVTKGDGTGTDTDTGADGAEGSPTMMMTLEQCIEACGLLPLQALVMLYFFIALFCSQSASSSAEVWDEYTAWFKDQDALVTLDPETETFYLRLEPPTGTDGAHSVDGTGTGTGTGGTNNSTASGGDKKNKGKGKGNSNDATSSQSDASKESDDILKFVSLYAAGVPSLQEEGHKSTKHGGGGGGGGASTMSHVEELPFHLAFGDGPSFKNLHTLRMLAAVINQHRVILSDPRHLESIAWAKGAIAKTKDTPEKAPFSYPQDQEKADKFLHYFLYMYGSIARARSLEVLLQQQSIWRFTEQIVNASDELLRRQHSSKRNIDGLLAAGCEAVAEWLTQSRACLASWNRALYAAVQALTHARPMGGEEVVISSMVFLQRGCLLQDVPSEVVATFSFLQSVMREHKEKQLPHLKGPVQDFSSMATGIESFEWAAKETLINLDRLAEWVHIQREMELWRLIALSTRSCFDPLSPLFINVLRVVACTKWLPEMERLSEKAFEEALEAFADDDKKKTQQQQQQQGKGKKKKNKKNNNKQEIKAATTPAKEEEKKASGKEKLANGGANHTDDSDEEEEEDRPETVVDSDEEGEEEAGGGGGGGGGDTSDGYQRMLAEFGLEMEEEGAADLLALASRQKRGDAAQHSSSTTTGANAASKQHRPASSISNINSTGTTVSVKRVIPTSITSSSSSHDNNTTTSSSRPPNNSAAIVRITSRHGDWACSCGAENIRLHSHCNKCSHPPPCRDWGRGVGCRFGRHCRWAHPPFDIPPSTTTTTGSGGAISSGPITNVNSNGNGGTAAVPPQRPNVVVIRKPVYNNSNGPPGATYKPQAQQAQQQQAPRPPLPQQQYHWQQQQSLPAISTLTSNRGGNGGGGSGAGTPTVLGSSLMMPLSAHSSPLLSTSSVTTSAPTSSEAGGGLGMAAHFQQQEQQQLQQPALGNTGASNWTALGGIQSPLLNNNNNNNNGMPGLVLASSSAIETSQLQDENAYISQLLGGLYVREEGPALLHHHQHEHELDTNGESMVNYLLNSPQQSPPPPSSLQHIHHQGEQQQAQQPRDGLMHAVAQCLWNSQSFHSAVVNWPPVLYRADPAIRALHALFSTMDAIQMHHSFKTAAAAAAAGGGGTGGAGAWANSPEYDLLLTELRNALGIWTVIDPSEVLTSLFQRVAEVCGMMGILPSPADAIFGIEVTEELECSLCGLKSHFNTQRSYFHTAKTSTVCAQLTATGNGNDMNHNSLGALLRLPSQHEKSCDIALGGCGMLSAPTKKLSHIPAAFTVQLYWDNQSSSESITVCLRAVSEILDLADILPSSDNSTTSTTTTTNNNNNNNNNNNQRQQQRGLHVYKLRSVLGVSSNATSTQGGLKYLALVDTDSSDNSNRGVSSSSSSWVIKDEHGASNGMLPMNWGSLVEYLSSTGSMIPVLLFYESIGGGR